MEVAYYSSAQLVRRKPSVNADEEFQAAQGLSWLKSQTYSLESCRTFQNQQPSASQVEAHCDPQTTAAERTGSGASSSSSFEFGEISEPSASGRGNRCLGKRARSADRAADLAVAGPAKSQKKWSGWRGISRQKRTGKFEVHFWRNGRQLHIGSFADEEMAARVFDLLVIKWRRPGSYTNFPVAEYVAIVNYLPSDEAELISLLRRSQSQIDGSAFGRPPVLSEQPELE